MRADECERGRARASRRGALGLVFAVVFMASGAGANRLYPWMFTRGDCQSHLLMIRDANRQSGAPWIPLGVGDIPVRIDLAFHCVEVRCEPTKLNPGEPSEWMLNTECWRVIRDD